MHWSDGCGLDREGLENLLDGTPAIVYRLRHEQGWPSVAISDGCRELLGYDPERIVTGEIDWIDDVVDPDDTPRLRQTLETDLAADDGYDIAYRVETATGNTRWLRDRGSLVDTSEGAFVDSIRTDVTADRRRQRDLEQTNQMLDQFVGVVSHDLRSPLTIARGQLELAQRLEEFDRLDRVEDAHERMTRLLDTLSRLARTGEEVGVMRELQLSACAHEAWDLLDTAEADLLVDCGSAVVEADRPRLEQAFENLYRNAIEHGGPDVTVTVGLLSDRSGFYVEDDGPGIPEADRENVFETGFSTAEGGSGLGLMIVDTVVRGHGWDIHAAESADGGARFEISGVEIKSRERSQRRR